MDNSSVTQSHDGYESPSKYKRTRRKINQPEIEIGNLDSVDKRKSFASSDENSDYNVDSDPEDGPLTAKTSMHFNSSINNKKHRNVSSMNVNSHKDITSNKTNLTAKVDEQFRDKRPSDLVEYQTPHEAIFDTTKYDYNVPRYGQGNKQLDIATPTESSEDYRYLGDDNTNNHMRGRNKDISPHNRNARPRSSCIKKEVLRSKDGSDQSSPKRVRFKAGLVEESQVKPTDLEQRLSQHISEVQNRQQNVNDENDESLENQAVREVNRTEFETRYSRQQNTDDTDYKFGKRLRSQERLNLADEELKTMYGPSSTDVRRRRLINTKEQNTENSTVPKSINNPPNSFQMKNIVNNVELNKKHPPQNYQTNTSVIQEVSSRFEQSYDDHSDLRNSNTIRSARNRSPFNIRNQLNRNDSHYKTTTKYSPAKGIYRTVHDEKPDYEVERQVLTQRYNNSNASDRGLSDYKPLKSSTSTVKTSFTDQRVGSPTRRMNIPARVQNDYRKAHETSYVESHSRGKSSPIHEEYSHKYEPVKDEYKYISTPVETTYKRASKPNYVETETRRTTRPVEIEYEHISEPVHNEINTRHMPPPPEVEYKPIPEPVQYETEYRHAPKTETHLKYPQEQRPIDIEYRRVQAPPPIHINSEDLMSPMSSDIQYKYQNPQILSEESVHLPASPNQKSSFMSQQRHVNHMSPRRRSPPRQRRSQERKIRDPGAELNALSRFYMNNMLLKTVENLVFEIVPESVQTEKQRQMEKVVKKEVKVAAPPKKVEAPVVVVEPPAPKIEAKPETKEFMTVMDMVKQEDNVSDSDDTDEMTVINQIIQSKEKKEFKNKYVKSRDIDSFGIKFEGDKEVNGVKALPYQEKSNVPNIDLKLNKKNKNLVKGDLWCNECFDLVKNGRELEHQKICRPFLSSKDVIEAKTEVEIQELPYVNEKIFKVSKAITQRLSGVLKTNSGIFDETAEIRLLRNLRQKAEDTEKNNRNIKGLEIMLESMNQITNDSKGNDDLYWVFVFSKRLQRLTDDKLDILHKIKESEAQTKSDNVQDSIRNSFIKDTSLRLTNTKHKLNQSINFDDVKSVLLSPYRNRETASDSRLKNLKIKNHKGTKLLNDSTLYNKRNTRNI